MNAQSCKDLLQANIDSIADAFSNGVQQKTDRILSCLYSCLKKSFIKWAGIAYKHYPAEFIEQVSDSSFTDGILKFTEVAAGKGLYNGNASIRTVVFAFFRNKLRENLQKERRYAARHRQSPLEESVIAVETEEPTNTEQLYGVLTAALRQMKEEDRQIITWRHIDEKSNEEIAALLNITVASATNRIYRCMERLKALTQTTNR